jgi:DNA-binding transcriptional LysR family regulator
VSADIVPRWIAALIAVADAGSITKAATRMHLTQQAVSAQLNQLERAVDAVLLVRTSRGVALTAAGKALVQHGQPWLAELDRLAEEVRLTGQGRAGRLRLCFKMQSTVHFIPELLRRLAEDAPDIEIETRSVANVPEALRALHSGETDAAFVWLPIADDSLVSADVLTEQRMIALAPDHPLAARDELSLADLRDEPVIGPHRDLPEEVMRFWNVDPRPDGSSPVLGPSANTPEECLLHVNAGRGIWPAPASTAEYFTQRLVEWRPLTDAAPITLGLVWHRDRPPQMLPRLLSLSRSLAAREKDRA